MTVFQKSHELVISKTMIHIFLYGEETLFVDDNIGHIDRAAAAGLHTHHFNGHDGFMKRLQELNLIGI